MFQNISLLNIRQFCLASFITITADDEQSDFYYESGPACGIPGIIRWWENSPGDIEAESDRQFQQILSSSLEHVPKSSKLAFQARVTRMMAKVKWNFWMGEMYVVILWINFEKALDLLKMIQVHVYCYNISVQLSVKHTGIFLALCISLF